MKRSLTTTLPSVALLFLTLSGSALADHQAPNLKAFKTVCISGSFEEQDKENEAVLDRLLGRMRDALDAAGIKVNDGCKLEAGVGGGTQLNLYYAFSTTTSGAVYDAALEGWLDREGPYRDVAIWRDSYYGSIKAGAGAIQAADIVDELMDGFIKEWDSVH